MARKHLIEFDSCINDKGNYELTWYSKLDTENETEIAESVESFKKRIEKTREFVASNVILDILKDYGIKVDNLSNNSYENALNELKTKHGIEIVIKFTKNSIQNLKTLGLVNNGGYIFLTNDNYLFYMEIIELWQDTKRKGQKI